MKTFFFSVTGDVCGVGVPQWGGVTSYRAQSLQKGNLRRPPGIRRDLRPPDLTERTVDLFLSPSDPDVRRLCLHRCAAAPVGCIFLFDLLEKKLEMGKCEQAAPCLLRATTEHC